MNCDCINVVDDKLREQNMRLSGYAFVVPSFKAVIHVQTAWVDASKAPKGKKRTPPPVLVPFCPFCGKRAQSPTAATGLNTDPSTSAPATPNQGTAC